MGAVASEYWSHAAELLGHHEHQSGLVPHAICSYMLIGPNKLDSSWEVKSDVGVVDIIYNGYKMSYITLQWESHPDPQPDPPNLQVA